MLINLSKYKNDMHITDATLLLYVDTPISWRPPLVTELHLIRLLFLYSTQIYKYQLNSYLYKQRQIVQEKTTYLPKELAHIFSVNNYPMFVDTQLKNPIRISK